MLEVTALHYEPHTAVNWMAFEDISSHLDIYTNGRALSLQVRGGEKGGWETSLSLVSVKALTSVARTNSP